jgi:hypothetical protein
MLAGEDNPLVVDATAIQQKIYEQGGNSDTG